GFGPVLLGIGLGMAAMIENFLNRKLARVVGEIEVIAADRANFILRRYPVETIAQIQIDFADGKGWQNQTPLTDFYNSVDTDAGIVMCPEDQDVGPYYARVQFTYTGG